MAAAVIQLPAIHKLARAIEDIEFRRTGCFKGARDGLAFVVAIWERETEFGRLLAHAIGRIGWIGRGVVRGNGDNAHRFGGIIAA